MPLLLLGLATYARIDQYGITEERYGLVLVVIAGTIILVAAALLRRPFYIRIVPPSSQTWPGSRRPVPSARQRRWCAARSREPRPFSPPSAPPNHWATKGIDAHQRSGGDGAGGHEGPRPSGRLAALTEAPILACRTAQDVGRISDRAAGLAVVGEQFDRTPTGYSMEECLLGGLPAVEDNADTDVRPLVRFAREPSQPIGPMDGCRTGQPSDRQRRRAV